MVQIVVAVLTVAVKAELAIGEAVTIQLQAH